jgi:hypothetical protein
MRDLSLHLLDIIQNSVSAGATSIKVSIIADLQIGLLEMTVEDNGCGMDEEMLAIVTDPFTTSRTTRKVGLGIPLLKEACEITGGSMEIESTKGKGTLIRTKMKISSIDRIPLGDIGETFMGLAMDCEKINYNLRLSDKKKEFVLDFQEIKNQLGDVPITEMDVLVWIKETIEEEKNEIFRGILNEIA